MVYRLIESVFLESETSFKVIGTLSQLVCLESRAMEIVGMNSRRERLCFLRRRSLAAGE